MDRNDMDRRAYRHKRRIRNQIGCWLILVVAIAVLGFGAYFAADALGKKFSKEIVHPEEGVYDMTGGIDLGTVKSTKAADVISTRQY